MHAMTMTPIQRFSDQFRRFWVDAPGPQLLSVLQQSTCWDCATVRAWGRGGCLTWAYAVAQWAIDSMALTRFCTVSMYAIETDETSAAHVLVRVERLGREWFLDSTGVWTRQELEGRLAQEYLYDIYHLIPWSRVDLKWMHIPFDPEVAQKVEATLFEVLGPFTLGLICVDPTL